MASTWFGALLGLYAIYALLVFSRLPSRFSGADRIIMILGPTTIALALLASAATFAASVMRFDLLTARDIERRRSYLAWLAGFGLGVYLLVAFGTPAIRSMLPSVSDLPAEALPSSANALNGLRLLVPIPLAVFAVLSGVAGALVGRKISRSVLKHAGAVPWLACFGLVGAFSASLFGTASLIVQHGFPSVWIVIAPVIVPLIVVAALAKREGSGLRSLVGLSEEKVDPVDPDSVDQILSLVIESRHAKIDPGAATTVSTEDDVAHLVHSIRHVAGSRVRMSPARVSAIVEHLVAQDDGRTQPVAQSHSKPRAVAGELCSACASMAAGCLVIGSIGGLMPSISAAVIAGTIGSAIAFFVPPRSTEPLRRL